MNDQNAFLIRDGEELVLSTNPFKFVYEDALFFQKAAENATDRNLEVRYARNAVLLFVIGMEALINRVFHYFIKDDFPAFVKEKICDLPLDMKWYMASLWCSDDPKALTYEADKEPFQSFRELIKIRNSYVHPFPQKWDLYVKMAQQKTVDYVDPNPLHWPQTKIPKDLHHFSKKSALKAKEVVDDMVNLLDGFLGGRIKRDDWWLTEIIDKHE